LLQAARAQIAAMIGAAERGGPNVATIRYGIAARRMLGAAGGSLVGACLRDQVRALVACDDPDCRARRVVELGPIYEALRQLLCAACRGSRARPRGARGPIAHREDPRASH
jgi:hypothetical protein